MNLPIILAAADGFSRAVFEDWHTTVPMVAFVLTFAAFVYFTIRALQMKSGEREHLASLPLADEQDQLQPPSHH